ncbi:MAG TPA: hypothetical protein VFV99_20085 [Kofleriaceae bacterium]|nr:hypothetical protein [Kofleriaceae bacterium]
MRLIAIAAMLCVAHTSAAAPCTREAVAGEVRALGGDLDGAGDRVQIVMHRDGRGAEGSIVYTSAAGDVTAPRVVHATSCGELAKSLALIVVMSLRADEQVDAPAPVMAPAMIPPATTPPMTTTPTTTMTSNELVNHSTTSDTRAHSSTRHVALFVGAASDTTAHPALELGSRWRHDRLSLGLELRIATPESIDVGDGGTVNVATAGLDAVPCFHAGYLGLCGLATAGMISAEGQALANAATARRAAFAIGGRIELDVPLLHRLSLRVHLDGLQALTSSRFLVDQMPVWTSEPRELWLGAGVLAKFP